MVRMKRMWMTHQTLSSAQGSTISTVSPAHTQPLLHATVLHAEGPAGGFDVGSYFMEVGLAKRGSAIGDTAAEAEARGKKGGGRRGRRKPFLLLEGGILVYICPHRAEVKRDHGKDDSDWLSTSPLHTVLSTSACTSPILLGRVRGRGGEE